MEIRPAEISEAGQVCSVLRRSIAELCELDHKGSEEILSGWLRNKTIENVRAWIARSDQKMLVAVVGQHIVGVGAATENGEITLNYVSPDFRGQGVSKAILAGLESYLVSKGNSVVQLTCTATAHRFYLGAGYEDAGQPAPWREGSRVYPMQKALEVSQNSVVEV